MTSPVDSWDVYWGVYVYFAVGGIPWEGRIFPPEPRLAGYETLASHLIIVPIGSGSCFIRWVLDFLDRDQPTGLDSGEMLPTVPFLVPGDHTTRPVVTYHYCDVCVPRPVHPTVREVVSLTELMRHAMGVFPRFERILAESEYSEKLVSPLWRSIRWNRRVLVRRWQAWCAEHESLLP